MNEPLNFVEEKISKQQVRAQQPMNAAQMREQLKAMEAEEKAAARANKGAAPERDIFAVFLSVTALLVLTGICIGVWAIWYAQVFVK